MEMFSNNEVKVFGIAMLAFVMAVIVVYFALIALNKYIELRYEKKRLQSVRRRIFVDKNEFERIGNEALSRQKMQSFIIETSGDNLYEVIKDIEAAAPEEGGDAVNVN